MKAGRMQSCVGTYADKENHPWKTHDLCGFVHTSLDKEPVCPLPFSLVLPEALMARGDKRQVTVLLEPKDDERFSAYCEQRGFKKSTLIVRLIREHLDDERFAAQPNLFGGHVDDSPGSLPRRTGVESSSTNPRGTRRNNG